VADDEPSTATKETLKIQWKSPKSPRPKARECQHQGAKPQVYTARTANQAGLIYLEIAECLQQPADRKIASIFPETSFLHYEDASFYAGVLVEYF
jgi:hypothetical protein